MIKVKVLIFLIHNKFRREKNIQYYRNNYGFNKSVIDVKNFEIIISYNPLKLFGKCSLKIISLIK
jgi:hypothetical protein